MPINGRLCQRSASGLNLVTAAIVLWNTTYIERAIHSLKARDQKVKDELLQHLSPLGWEHINLIGDYVWRNNKRLGEGTFTCLISHIPQVRPHLRIIFEMAALKPVEYDV